MSSLARTRQRVVKIIRQQERAKIFNKIRSRQLERLYANNLPELDRASVNEISNIRKKSFLKNELIHDVRQHLLLKMLQDKIILTENIEQFQEILTIFTNLLIDNLKLGQKQQIARILIEAYSNKMFLQEFKSNTLHLTLYKNVLGNVVNFVDILHFIDQVIAIKCQNLLLNLIEHIFQEIFHFQNIKSLDQCQKMLLQDLSSLLVQFMQRYLHSHSEYIIEISYKFQRNICFFHKILNGHKKVANNPNKSKYLQIVHQGLVNVYEYLSQILNTSNYPTFFEDPQFIMLPFNEVIVSESQTSTKTSLYLIINILSKYEESGLYNILDSVKDKLDNQNKELFFKKLIQIDRNTCYKLELIKIMITFEELYQFFKQTLQTYWKCLVDKCLQVIKTMNQIQEIKIALEVIAYFTQKNKDQNVLSYFISIGGKAILQFLMINQYQLFYEENREVYEKVDFIVNYLLQFENSENI